MNLIQGTIVNILSGNCRFFANVSVKDGYHDRPKLDPEDFYLAPEGYVVFTEKYLLKRGYCCKNGCRHCPYGFNIKTGRIEKK